MGIIWTQPKPISDGSKIMIKAQFPNTQILRSQLWNLWKRHKIALRNDGFSVSKYRDVWYICYFETIKCDSYYLRDTEDGRIPQYMIDFKIKHCTWKANSENLGMLEPDPDSESWYYAMETDDN